jgi:integrase
MPRTPSIRYYDSRHAYYTKYHGRQHLLAAGPKDEPDGRTYLAAVGRFSQIMHADELERAEDTAPVSAVIVRYYHSLEREKRKNTLHLARTMLDPAIAEFGHVKVKELRPIVVSDWLAKMSDEGKRERKGREKPWNSTTQNTALGVLARAFNWAKEQGIVTKNPVAGMAKPEKRVRGKEVVIPEALQDLLIATAHPALGKFLRVLRGTGARPGEVIHAECKHYRPEIAALVFPWNPPPGEYRWKTAKKTKRDRVIYLSPELQALVEEEVKARGGAGRIFLSPRGKSWNINNLVNRMTKLIRHKTIKKWCGEAGFSAGKIMAYGFRHSYITRMLNAGCPIKVLADLCGTSVKMIEETYSHAHDDLLAMRRLFLQFNGGASSPPAP